MLKALRSINQNILGKNASRVFNKFWSFSRHNQRKIKEFPNLMLNQEEIANQTKKVVQFWDVFSSAYTQNEESRNSPFYASLISTLRIGLAKNILETSVGGGQLLPFLIDLKPEDCRLVATDLSPKMLEIAEANLSRYQQKRAIRADAAELQPLIQKSKFFPHLNLELLLEDNQSLSSFSDNQFDRYISNFSLHLVPSPDLMLKHAYRVLQNEGWIGLAVWGEMGKCNYLTTFDIICRKHDVLPIEKGIRSPFHLSQKSTLVDLMNKAGFKNVIVWNMTTPTYLLGPKDVEKYLNSGHAFETLSKIDKEKADAIRNEFVKVVADLWEKNETLFFDSYLVVGQK